MNFLKRFFKKKEQWQARGFYISGNWENEIIRKVEGYTYRGIGLHQIADADCFIITHLGTGHRMFGVRCVKRCAGPMVL